MIAGDLSVGQADGGRETRAERRAVAALARGDAYFQQSDPPGSFPAPPLQGEIENAQYQSAPASVSASQLRGWRSPSSPAHCVRVSAIGSRVTEFAPAA
jgi:hypothetical protein